MLAGTKSEEEPPAPVILDEVRQYCEELPDSQECLELCQPCQSSRLCTKCMRRQPDCRNNTCKFATISGFRDKVANIVNTTRDDGGVEREGRIRDVLEKIKEFVGEPSEDSPCFDLKGVDRTTCSLIEASNSQHCEELRRIPLIRCSGEHIQRGATTRYIVSGLLLFSLLGHLVGVIFSAWCNEAGSLDYQPASEDAKEENTV